jgi:hypothetical protein
MLAIGADGDLDLQGCCAVLEMIDALAADVQQAGFGLALAIQQ